MTHNLQIAGWFKKMGVTFWLVAALAAAAKAGFDASS